MVNDCWLGFSVCEETAVVFSHDHVIKWKHLPRCWTFVRGIRRSHRPVTRSFDVLFYLRWINGWVNNREAGDFRRHRAHYDVIVMHAHYPWSATSQGNPFMQKFILRWSNTSYFSKDKDITQTFGAVQYIMKNQKFGNPLLWFSASCITFIDCPSAWNWRGIAWNYFHRYYPCESIPWNTTSLLYDLIFQCPRNILFGAFS